MADASALAQSAHERRTQQRRRDIASAEAVLRGRELSAEDTWKLAERLRKTNDFGLARRLYGRIWTMAEWHDLPETAARVGQRAALATYKDPDLPAADRFRRALEILDHVDQLDLGMSPPSQGGAGAPRSARLEVAQRQESLGLRGAIYKRRWQIEAQHVDLERSLGCYLKGYDLGFAFAENQLGVESDQGYNGINAAYVLDLLAREDARQAREAGIDPHRARDRFEQANAIRRRLVERLALLPAQDGYAWLVDRWWFHATVAEALVGLGAFDEAVAALRGYNAVHQLVNPGLPVDVVDPWELESTITQLTSLLRLRTELVGLLEPGTAPLRPGAPMLGPADWIAGGRGALGPYLGTFRPALERAEIGKVGLALSGGGFRASLVHIGVLAHLAERDILRHVEVLSCVSGGSIVGAHYYLELKRLLETVPDGELRPQDYVELVERLERDFLAGVQTNLRGQVFASIWANVRALLQPGYTTTRRLGELYETCLYARVKDGAGARPRHLRDLFVRPKDDRDDFNPKVDNWRRHGKVPMLVLNAATLNTGHNWQFTASWMGEPPAGLDAEIEGNYRLRRMYHCEAPQQKERWTRWFARPFAPPDYGRIRLGEAVAASSSVPGLFEPIVYPDLYEGRVVRLVDGGVHDNQGIASLLEQDCNVMIVSDASGQMGALDHPSGSRVGVALRSFSIAMTRVRQAQYRECAARRRSGLLRRLSFLHLRRDLDADPVDWRDCQDPYDASDEARPAFRRGVKTTFGIQKSVQRLLSEIRTDLDAFSDLEAFALMASGYRQAETQLASQYEWEDPVRPDKPWRFLAVEPLLEPGPDFEQVKRLLRIGAQVALKSWRVAPALGAIGVVLLVAAAGGALFLGWTYRAVELATVGSAGRALLLVLAPLLARQVVAVVRYRHTAHGAGLKALAGVVLAVGFKLHLLLFDRVFLRRGRLGRFGSDPKCRP